MRWPGRWLDFRPLPFRFASWVGYDMDGRTDISWATSLRYRLEEKAERLARYREIPALQGTIPLIGTPDRPRLPVPSSLTSIHAF